MSSQIIPSPVPPINTSRLFIRPIQESDAPDIYAIRGRYDVMKWRYSNIPFPHVPHSVIELYNSTYEDHGYIKMDIK